MLDCEKKPFLIAEIGCNHKGDLDIAKEMIKVAALFCKVDAVKFQKRNPRELLSDYEYNSPHPNSINSYGTTYGLHREALEFNLTQHKELANMCRECNVEYSASVWDLTSAKEISKLRPSFIKVPSACNLNFKMMDYLLKNFSGHIHLSLGMTSQREEEQIVELFLKARRNSDLILYSCVSGYPVDFEDLSLLEIVRLISKFGNIVNSIGFSGHHLGIAADIAALALGAKYFERHFTLDRTWKGTDHAASLEPDGMRRLGRDLQNISKSLTYKREEILEVEKNQRIKLKKNVSEF